MSDSGDMSDRISFGDGREALLVPWHAVDRELELERARGLLRSAFDDPPSASALRRLAEEQTVVDGLDDAAIVERIAGMLASGALVLVNLPRSESAYLPTYFARSDGDDAGSTPLLSDLLPTERRPEERVTWIEIQCVGLAGAAYAGAEVRLSLPSAETVEARLDASSTLRLEVIKSPGTCRFEIPAGSRRSGTMRLEERPRITGQEPRVRCGGTPLALATGARHVVIVEASHVFSC